MPSSTGKQESKMKPSLPSLHVRLPSTDSGIQADASGFDSLSRYKGKHFLSSSGPKMDSSSPLPSTALSDLADLSQQSSQSPCSSSGYSSEARGATPPSLPAKPPRSSTPPISSSASPLSASSNKDTRAALPAAMTSSWAGTTSFSKSKPQTVEIQVPSRISAPAGNEATGKMKRSTIHIPPKPKVPPPKRPTAPPPSASAVKMITSEDGVKVSISRANPSAVQSSAQNAPPASHVANQRSFERNSDDNHSQTKTTIDVRPSSGSTVKVKILSGAGPRPQPQPRSTTSPARQGQGCIPLTRPLRVVPPSSSNVRRATPRKAAMCQPPPPPPHSEQLQQLQQRHHQTAAPHTGSKPRPLAPKPQVSPRKTFLTPANPPRPANIQTSGGGDSSSIPTTSASSATTCITTAAITSTKPKNSNTTQKNTTATSATTSSISSRPINVPISSKQRLKDNTPNIKIKPRQIHDNSVHKSPSSSPARSSSPSSVSSPRATANKTPIDSCTFMYKSPEKSFFTQTFYSKENSTKAAVSSETPTSPKLYASSSPLSGKSGLHDHRHLGFIRDDLKAGDKQSRMRHAELILKRSDELFKDAWSFLNASDEEIDRCFFSDDFLKSHSPTPERISVGESNRSFSPGFSRTSEELKVVNGKDNATSVESVTSENKFPTNQMADEKGELIPWKTRKERIDSALSWLKKELASLRDMDKNIVNQFRRCQDTIETLKNQREIWEGLSEEGEEADYWDDLEINEFNRNYLNSPEGSSLSPMSSGSRDLSFQEISTVVSLPVPQHSPTNAKPPSLTGSVTQDVEATL